MLTSIVFVELAITPTNLMIQIETKAKPLGHKSSNLVLVSWYLKLLVKATDMNFFCRTSRLYPNPNFRPLKKRVLH